MDDKASAVPKGTILQRDGETYAIKPRLSRSGMLDLAAIKRLVDVGERFNIPTVKIGSAQRIILVGLKPEQVEPVSQALGVERNPVDNCCVHYVIACPGTVACRYGLQDSLGLGAELDKRFIGSNSLPYKFKIGISGCPRCCSQSWLRDFGAYGTENGWTLIVGGLAGTYPRIGDKLIDDVATEEVPNMLYRILDAFKKLGQSDERLGTTIKRVGFEAFKSAVLG